MSDSNDPRPGDQTNNLLRKILNRLGGGSTGTASATSQGADAQNSTPSGNPVTVAGELANPSSLPANGVAGTIRRLLTNLKGVLLVQQGDLSKDFDSVKVWPSDATVPISSVALEASKVIKSAPGKLMFLCAYNDKASAQYIQLHNATALPSNGAVPVLIFQLATKAVQVIPFPDTTGFDFSTGIVVANSSTGATLTVGSADCFFSALYI
jgi:hypothetical protein